MTVLCTCQTLCMSKKHAPHTSVDTVHTSDARRYVLWSERTYNHSVGFGVACILLYGVCMVCTYSTLFIHHQRQMGITRTRKSIRCPVQYLAYTTHSPQISAHLDASRFSRSQRTQYLDPLQTGNQRHRIVTLTPCPAEVHETTSSSLKGDRRSEDRHYALLSGAGRGEYGPRRCYSKRCNVEA